jgi:hypothetical protein
MRSGNSGVATRLVTELISCLYLASTTPNMSKSLHVFNENARVRSFPRRMEDFSVLQPHRAQDRHWVLFVLRQFFSAAHTKTFQCKAVIAICRTRQNGCVKLFDLGLRSLKALNRFDLLFFRTGRDGWLLPIVVLLNASFFTAASDVGRSLYRKTSFSAAC